MQEFSTKAKPSNNNARIIMSLFLAFAAVTAVASMLVDRFSGLISILTVALISGAVFIYTRYVSCEYFYDLTTDHTGDRIFVVRQVTGKRETTLARVSLSEICKVERENSATAKSHRTPAGFKKYFYTPTLMPEHICRLTVVGRYESSEIVIECSDEYADVLSNLSKEASASIVKPDVEL
jgi:hypothetical protein